MKPPEHVAQRSVLHQAVLLLGSNIEPSEIYLAKARERIERLLTDLRTSSIYQSPTLGYHTDAKYLNQVLAGQTALRPDYLLEAVLGIEQELGRVRTEARYGPRTIDIDLLFYDDLVVNSPHAIPQLTIPHPRLHERRSTLLALAQLMPDYVHPVLCRSVSQLLARCPDLSIVKKYT